MCKFKHIDLNSSKINMCVLMSTYNGHVYVDEQVKSILNQDGVELNILIRDDGSTDMKFLNKLKYYGENKKIQILYGENIGPCRSFFSLLSFAEGSAFYAFSDQDDVWAPGKLRRAIELIGITDIPTMSICRLEYVDKDLRPLGLSAPLLRPGLGNALVENLAVGCCCVLNDAARCLLVRNLPVWAPMHDSWAYLVISALGRIVIDPEVGVLYRQHGANVVGGTPGFWASLPDRVRGLRKRSRVTAFRKQSAEFLHLYGSDLSVDQRALVDWHASEHHGLSSRICEVFRMRFYRNRWIDSFVTKTFIILNRH